MGEVSERSEDGEGIPGCKALSVTFGDSSPRGRAKGASRCIACWNGNGSGNSPGAVLSYLRNLNAECLHLPAKLGRVAVEDNARHTGAFRALNVLGGIVDKQTFLGNKTERLV